MKLSRYMSKKELDKYLDGETLVNTTDYSKLRASTSIGFCFLGQKTYIGVNRLHHRVYYTPEQCYDFLYGIVSDNCLVTFEVPDEMVRKTYGVYWSDYTDSNRRKVTEYCMERYGYKLGVKLVKLQVIDDFDKFKTLYDNPDGLVFNTNNQTK